MYLKLRKLYSTTNLLTKDIVFQDGLNIILGKYSQRHNRNDINGIGKSSLIRLVNFMLLSEGASKILSDKRYNFLRDEQHSLSLEFELENQIFTIHRVFQELDYIQLENKNSKSELNFKEAKEKLFALFFPSSTDVILNGNKYGTLLNFFIKDDLESLQRIDPLNFYAFTFKPNLIERNLYNFFLLNLPTRIIESFSSTIKDYDSINETKKTLIKKMETDTGKPIEEFKTERLGIEKNITILENAIKNYTFAEKYQNTENKIMEITEQINMRLKDYHSINNKLKKIIESYSINLDFDTNKLAIIYNQSLETFGDLVKKSLDEVKDFKKQLVLNRNKFLYSREIEFNQESKRILDEINKLESQRKEHYKKLEEKGALESITNTYQEIIEEKTKLNTNLESLRRIEDLENSLGELDVTISTLKRDIQVQLKKFEEDIKSLRILFQEILENAISLEENSESYFDISIKTSKSKKQLPFDIKIEIPKADALGRSRLKVIAYDFLVFLHNMQLNRKFPSFLIHDGVFHGISEVTLVRSLNFMNSKFLELGNFQYIVTFNEDELPNNKSASKFNFPFNDVTIISLEDIESKMLFKRNFI